MEGRLREAARDWLQGIKERCQDCGQRLERLHPVRLLSDTEHRMALLAQRLQQGMRRRLEQIGEAIQSREGNLRMLGPQSVLARGFSYTLNAQGKVIRSADEVVAGEVIHTHLERGVLQSVVKGPVEE